MRLWTLDWPMDDNNSYLKNNDYYCYSFIFGVNDGPWPVLGPVPGLLTLGLTVGPVPGVCIFGVVGVSSVASASGSAASPS